MRKIIGIFKRDLEKLYIKRKMTTYEIAKYYRCSQATIWKLLHKYNILLRRPGNCLDISYSVLKELYINKKLSSRKIAKIYNCAYSTIDRKIKKCGFRIRNRAQAHIIYARRSFSGNLFEKAYLIVSEIEYSLFRYNRRGNWGIAGNPPRGDSGENATRRSIFANAQEGSIDPYWTKDSARGRSPSAYLVGFSIGDLRIRKFYKNSETISIDCASTELQQIRLIRDLFISYGRVWIGNKDKRGKRQIQAQVDLSFDFLLNLDGSIDRWILNNKDYFSAFLAGFTDAEGSFFISNGKAFYSLGNYNKKILDQVYKKLIELGIYFSEPRHDNKKGYKDKQGYIRRQNYWTLRINRKQSLMCIFKLIGTYLRHDKKKSDFKKSKEKYSRTE